MATIDFVEINADEIIFYQDIPLKWQSHPAIKSYIHAKAGIRFTATRIPMFRLEKAKGTPNNFFSQQLFVNFLKFFVLDCQENGKRVQHRVMAIYLLVFNV